MRLLSLIIQRINIQYFQAYNIGASRAKYEILCFVHDDLFYMTQDWGKKLIKHFEDSEIGLIGVAGARFKSKYNSGWGCSHKRLRANVQETSPDGTIKKNVLQSK
ncbi:MAG: glycosyltransferase [Saprospiraceae bacterium]|nr:glycosyltransferase [Saprospiraceae bacterium]